MAYNTRNQLLFSSAITEQGEQMDYTAQLC
jgi:hypothetical protein